MKVVPKDGKLYAEVTLRDVVMRSDVSDTPILAEIKRLYEENDKLRELAHRVCGYIQFMQDTGKRDFELEELIIDMSRELGIEVR